MNSSSLLMTEGSIKGKIIRFALPLFWGNLFQQLYNMVDALVVGNFLGKDALAAVGSTASLIFLIVGFFIGLFSGAGIVISNYFGAKDYSRVEKAVGTAVAFGLISGVVLTIVGVFGTPLIIQAMGTPENVLQDATTYVRTYFSGIIFIVMYNTASGIFQAVGDSKHPLYYLITSSVVNIILDVVFVAGLHMGVQGAALATVVSQIVSVVLAFHKLTHLDSVYAVKIKNIRINGAMLKQILKIGLPAGIQNSVISLANVVVQSNINSFGAVAMAGCAAYSKVEGFVFIPVSCFSMALTTFVSQNIGAKQYDRVKQGAKFGITFSCVLAEVVGLAFFLFVPKILALFNGDPDVVAVGALRAYCNVLFYFMLAFSHAVSGVLRGAGKSTVPMFVMLICWCVIRVIYIVVVTSFINDIIVVYLAYPITWFLSSLFFAIYYKKVNWLEA